MPHEVAVLLDRTGNKLVWWDPLDPKAWAIDDHPDLWAMIWEHREVLGGVAHTHPGLGTPCPSLTDVTTWAAVEAGLGKRLVWPVVSFDGVTYWQYGGSETAHLLRGYSEQASPWMIEGQVLGELRERSRGTFHEQRSTNLGVP